MKRIIAMIVALFMISLLFISCSETEPAGENRSIISNTGDESESNQVNEEVTDEMLQNSLPKEYVAEKVAAGMEVTLAYLGYVDNQMIMEIFAEGVQEACDELGVTMVSTHANGDVSTQISQIENYITMGVACICLVPPDAETVMDAVMKAQDAGIAVVIYGVKGAGDYSISTRIDNESQGYHEGRMAAQWTRYRYPDAAEGEIKAALLGIVSIEEQKIKTDKAMEQMEAEPTLDVVYYFDGLNDSIDGGFNAMQDAMTYDKDIRVVVVTSYNAAIGAQNYIMSQPGVVCDEYGIFSGGLDSTLDQMLADAVAGNGVFRGSAAPLGTSAYYLGDTCRKALLGEIEAPYENLFEFDFRTVEGFVYEG